MQEQHRKVELDYGQEVVRFRRRWFQCSPHTAWPPPPVSFDDASILSYVTASLLPRLAYSWITPRLACFSSPSTSVLVA
ncbi:hypothetical protein B0H12DRAFT_1096299 [Mycena haematopus]|nr:hypothetical protein B0H12DRAFT_1096299 [Mycena haematopus]